jgi:glycosyltransferase involved in cell wall biosynthesis
VKITFIAPPDHMSGGLRVIAIFAEHLQRRGHDVLVVCPPAREIRTGKRVVKALRLLRKREPRAALAELRLIGTRPGSDGFLGRSACAVRTLETFRPVESADVPDGDLVVATWWKTAYWVARLEERKGEKVYFMMDYGAAGQELEKLIPTWRLDLHIITIAGWLERLVHEHAPNARVEVVDMAVDLTLFQQRARGLPERPTVGFLYREASVKGYDTVLQAYERARCEIPDLRVLTFGPAARDQLLHLPPEIAYHAGPADHELGELYGSCTAWILASRREGYGLPILEAMACGTPVISTRAGAAPEIIEQAGGWLVPTDDPEAMAEAIVACCRVDPAHWEELSRAGRRHVESYTWEDAGDAFEAALLRARDATP